MKREYFLKHKNTIVFPCTFDDETNRLVNIGKIDAVELLPIGVGRVGNSINKKMFARWLEERQIPNTRYGFKELLERIGVDNASELMLKNLGLNMTDHYWLCPAERNLKWEEINFFENDFSVEIDTVLLKRDYVQVGDTLDLNPAYTTSGNLAKAWMIEDGKAMLYKQGSHNYMQEPFNEVFASEMHKLNNCSNYVSYRLKNIDDIPYSVCENFVDVKTEFVSARNILESVKKDNQISYLQHFKSICLDHGIENVADEVDYMIATDYIIGNSDRHTNNFGIIRNAVTLEWIKLAPIFDSGNSLWFDLSTPRIDIKQDIKCNSFYQTQDTMIKHMESIPPNIRTEEIPFLLYDIFKQSADMSEERIRKIESGLTYRGRKYKNIVNEKD